MKKMILSLLLCGLVALQAGAAEQPKDEYREVMREMLELSGATRTYEVVMEQMAVMLGGTVDQKTLDEMMKIYSTEAFEKLWDMLVPVYKAHVSLEDMKAMRDFYKTPAGRRISAALPAITSASMEQSQVWAMELMQNMMTSIGR